MTGDSHLNLQRQRIHQLAAEIGFDLCGIARCEPLPDSAIYHQWVGAGMAGRMGYLTDHRAEIRSDPGRLLDGARSIVCVAKLYNGPEPHSTEFSSSELGWISRYAWGEDYHDVLGRMLDQLGERMDPAHRWRRFVDTAPLLERSYARAAGLGWIGKNTCLINEQRGSWFFLGELLTTLPLEPDVPAPDRCGTCRRCIDACPTDAIVPFGDWWTVDARNCISYYTIELRGPIPEEAHAGIGQHIFGCDICQDVCPWNRRGWGDRDVAFAPASPILVAPPLERMAALSESDFATLFRNTPVSRARYSGFLRNVCVAMGNAREPRFRAILERLTNIAPEDSVAKAAQYALTRLTGKER